MPEKTPLPFLKCACEYMNLKIHCGFCCKEGACGLVYPISSLIFALSCIIKVIKISASRKRKTVKIRRGRATVTDDSLPESLSLLRREGPALKGQKPGDDLITRSKTVSRTGSDAKGRLKGNIRSHLRASRQRTVLPDMSLLLQQSNC